MARDTEQKKRKKKKEDIKTLYKAEDYVECLKLINSLGDNLLKDLEFYTMKLFAHVSLKQFQEVLILQNRLQEFGHETTLPYGAWLMIADANKMQNNFLEAYLLYQRVLDHKDASGDGEVVKECRNSMKELQPKVQAELDIIAVERTTKFLEDEHAAASTSAGPASSTSAGPASSTSAGPASSTSAGPASSTSAQTAAASTSSTATASSSTASAFSSLSLVPSVDDTPPKLTKFTEDSSICFEMEQVNELSFIGAMKIGASYISKSCIKIGEELPSNVSSRFKKHPYILKIDFSIYSSSLSSRVAVVEPVRPLQTFFEMKLNDFKFGTSRAKANWWHYIKDDFHRIFRGVICGMVATYSEQKVCGDLEKAIYVTEEGDAKIFHTSEDMFTLTQIQKELYGLLSVIESIITLIDPRPRYEDLQTWLNEFESLYNLPPELLHFLKSLRVRKICDGIDPLFLIDHPFIWSINHRVYFIECLYEAIKERSINEKRFGVEFVSKFGSVDWHSEVSKDTLLAAIYDFKGYDYYFDRSRVINYIHAVLSHANDYLYDTARGRIDGLTLEERESLITKIFPSIYTTFYDTLCDYACNYKWLCQESFSKALGRLSSCGSQY